MEPIERIECAIKLLGDYELAGGNALVSTIHEWQIIIEEIDNIERNIEQTKIVEWFEVRTGLKNASLEKHMQIINQKLSIYAEFRLQVMMEYEEQALARTTMES